MLEPYKVHSRIVYLGACLIAALRLAPEEDWRNSPRVVNRIAESISMARRIYQRMLHEQQSAESDD
jgi:hypothetical protein